VNELSPRASDADRERTVVELREHLVQGRLTLDEFSERVELAYRARSLDELDAAGSALPTTRTGPIRRRPVRTIVGLFAHVVRRGRLKLGRRAVVLAGFSDVDVDLRGAEITGLATSLSVFILFGNVDVYVPEQIGIDVTGATVFGHRRQWGREAAGRESPVLRVRVFAFFGTADIWHVPPQLRGDYGEIIRSIRAGQRELPG
jgi:Domain of unknown function (DUF1707)